MENKKHESKMSGFAALLVDLQKDFWTPKIKKANPALPANIENLISTCRDNYIEIIHIRSMFKSDMSDWMPYQKLRRKMPAIKGTDGINPLDFAKERPDEKIFIKKSYDAFLTTDLSQYLLKNNKQFLLLAGLETSVCVFLTAASAAQKGFLVALITDCCAGETKESHDFIVKNYNNLTFNTATHKDILNKHNEWLIQIGVIKS